MVGSGKSPLPGLQLANFLLCPQMVETERTSTFSGFSFFPCLFINFERQCACMYEWGAVGRKKENPKQAPHCVSA